jgi:hypothetical protein
MPDLSLETWLRDRASLDTFVNGVLLFMPSFHVPSQQINSLFFEKVAAPALALAGALEPILRVKYQVAENLERKLTRHSRATH